MEGTAGGEFVAADWTAVFVGGHLDRAAGAFADRKLGMGVDVHWMEVVAQAMRGCKAAAP